MDDRYARRRFTTWERQRKEQKEHDKNAIRDFFDRETAPGKCATDWRGWPVDTGFERMPEHDRAYLRAAGLLRY